MIHIAMNGLNEEVHNYFADIYVKIIMEVQLTVYTELFTCTVMNVYKT